MIDTRAREIAEKLNQAGVPPKFEPEVSRLLIKVMRTLAKGEPITYEQTDQFISNIGMDKTEAEQFLRAVTERDAKDNIIGIVGLSLNKDWAHHFEVNGNSMRTWCAWDTLFIPLLLDDSASIESESPVSKQRIQVEVSPNGVKRTNPKEAVVSVVVLDGDNGQIDSVEEAWSQFCHQVYFFESRKEADEWAYQRSNIEILTVDEAFELGRYAWASVLAFV